MINFNQRFHIQSVSLEVKRDYFMVYVNSFVSLSLHIYTKLGNPARATSIMFVLGQAYCQNIIAFFLTRFMYDT
jgi:hypothetical protein